MATMAGHPSTAPREAEPPSGKLRWLLPAVCGTLLLLVLASGAAAVHFLGEMHTQQLAVTRALTERTQMLSGLWLSIQGYDQAVRQFVAQAQADRDQAAHRDLDRLTVEIEGELERYPATRDSDESALLEGMRNVFVEQRTVYVAILTARPAERRRQAESLLAEHRVPSGQQLLDWSGKLRAWNGERLQHADRALAAQFADVQGSLARALAIACASGLLLVAGSMAYILRLERQTRGRYVELARSRGELEQLSARLVDAQETERRNISRELHDEVGQTLGALLVDIGRLRPPAGRRPRVASASAT